MAQKLEFACVYEIFIIYLIVFRKHSLKQVKYFSSFFCLILWYKNIYYFLSLISVSRWSKTMEKRKNIALNCCCCVGHSIPNFKHENHFIDQKELASVGREQCSNNCGKTLCIMLQRNRYMCLINVGTQQHWQQVESLNFLIFGHFHLL